MSFLNSKFFDDIYDYSFKSCVLEFIDVIFIGEHFNRTDGFGGLIFHILFTFVAKSGHVYFFVRSGLT